MNFPTSPSVWFSVANVTPATDPLPTTTVRQAVERTTNVPTICCPNHRAAVVEGAEYHPLIAEAALAFKRHYPLALSPDMIWLAMLQGVARHIRNNAERLRSRVVHHQTRIELVMD